MGHGTPDWWGSEPTETTFQVQDVGELAVRLGSIAAFDRRGNVIWLSSFENGLGEFNYDSQGAGGSVVISTATAHRGAYSCKLTAGSDVLMNAGVMKYLSYPVLSRIGGEIAFTWNTAIDYLLLIHQLWDGSNLYYFAIKLDPSLGKAYYWSSAAAWVEIANLPAWTTSITTYHIAKLVVDLETKKYGYLILDDVGHSLAGISGHTSVSALAPCMLFLVDVYGPGGTNPYIYVDDMIITQNEP